MPLTVPGYFNPITEILRKEIKCLKSYLGVGMIASDPLLPLGALVPWCRIDALFGPQNILYIF